MVLKKVMQTSQKNMQQSMNTGAENDEKHLQTSVQAPRVLRPVGGYL